MRTLLCYKYTLAVAVVFSHGFEQRCGVIILPQNVLAVQPSSRGFNGKNSNPAFVCMVSTLPICPPQVQQAFCLYVESLVVVHVVQVSCPSNPKQCFDASDLSSIDYLVSAFSVSRRTHQRFSSQPISSRLAPSNQSCAAAAVVLLWCCCYLDGVRTPSVWGSFSRRRTR